MRDGVVTLAGFADSYTDKWTAERVASRVHGVRAVALDADRITVTIEGHTAILRGMVHSYAEFRDAERAARNARGVTQVRNELKVDPSVDATV